MTKKYKNVRNARLKNGNCILCFNFRRMTQEKGAVEKYIFRNELDNFFYFKIVIIFYFNHCNIVMMHICWALNEKVFKKINLFEQQFEIIEWFYFKFSSHAF